MNSILLSCALLLSIFSSVWVNSIDIDNVPKHELYALKSIYDAANGSDWYWTLPGEVWNFAVADPNPCRPKWQGIICSCDDLSCTIVQIQLSSFNMQGTLADVFSNLTNLFNFDVLDNGLNGTIPTSFGYLKNLTIINLSSNHFRGVIPSSFINNTATLRKFAAYNNLLTGQIPNGFLNSSNNILQSVLLFANMLSGTIPEISGNSLETINMQVNYLTGTLPESLCSCSVISSIKFSQNYLSGTIPPCIGNLSQLFDIHFYQNSLTGSLPEMYQNLDFPGQYEGYLNLLTGSIPNSICALHLEYFDLSNNYLTGTIPDCTADRLSMQFLSLSNNMLSGTITNMVSNLTFLNTLTVNNNLLSGTVPDISKMPSLEFFYVQNNQLSGPLNLYLNTTRQGLSFVDVSNNQFTGTLPVALFNRTVPLISFAAASNCLTGSIPAEICDLRFLLFLDLDGLSTARSCRTPVFPGLTFIKSFTLKNQITGGIPNCLFNMSHLNTLHLSGNSIDWSFPDDLVIYDSLMVLSLSHNKLTGTIPYSVQNKKWSTLDLSYNNLDGMIMSNWSFVDVDQSLVLQVNRLSGGIPSSLVNLPSINILTGNLFGCTFDRTSLPVHDTAYHIYQCGSNSFYAASIIWGVCISITILIFLAVYRFNAIISWLSTIYKHFNEFMSVYNEQEDGKGLQLFKKQLLAVLKTVVVISMLLIVIGITVYVVLTVYYRTADHQYAWTVSAAYLSGTTPAIVLLVMYILLIVLLFVIWLFLKNDLSKVVSKKLFTRNWSQISILSFVVFGNCILMSFVNFGYVEVLLNYGSGIVLVTQMSMALFKLIWNEFVIRSLVYFARGFYGDTKKVTESVSNRLTTISDINENVKFINAEMPFATFIILFNCIIAPCIATAAVDPNCFLDAFIAAKPVSTEFPVYNCDILQIQDRDCTAAVASIDYLDISYDPPYIYSYQCASSILTNYASVFVFMFLMVAFFKLITLAILVSCQTQLSHDSVIRYLMDKTIYKLLKPADMEDIRQKEVLFFKDRFVLRMICKVSVLLTFGVVFPPLAAIVCVAFITETYLNLIMIGRFLCSIEDRQVQLDFRNLIIDNLNGSLELLLSPVAWMIVPFAAIFYGFFVFDTYGDDVGVVKAIWAPVLVTVVPLLLWIGYRLVKLVSKSKESKTDELIRKSEQRDSVVVNVLYSDNAM